MRGPEAISRRARAAARVAGIWMHLSSQAMLYNVNHAVDLGVDPAKMPIHGSRPSDEKSLNLQENSR